uniref:Uncharacterized protein n=1 Tax=Anguilla anguilla TaxID=7936 RepID=A0A0E9QM35_ANGAN
MCLGILAFFSFFFSVCSDYSATEAGSDQSAVSH